MLVIQLGKDSAGAARALGKIAEALANSSDPRAIQKLLQAIDARPWNVRKAAAREYPGQKGGACCSGS